MGAVATQAWANASYGRAGLPSSVPGSRWRTSSRNSPTQTRSVPNGSSESSTERVARLPTPAGSASSGPGTGTASATRHRGTSSSPATRSTPWREPSIDDWTATRRAAPRLSRLRAGGWWRPPRAAVRRTPRRRRGSGLRRLLGQARRPARRRPSAAARRAPSALGIHQELFGRTPRNRWIEVDDGLREELSDRLAVLGYERLEDWAGVENLEERVEGEDAIDPVVLARLRERSN